MKKLLFLSAIALGLFSCNREEPPAPVAPVQPAAVHENYVVVNGDGHNNDTLRLSDYLMGAVVGDSINIQGCDTAGYAATGHYSHSVSLLDIILQLGTDSITTYNGNPSAIVIGPKLYSLLGASVSITAIGTAGGYVDGYYSGTFRQLSAPQLPITVTGKFSVQRN